MGKFLKIKVCGLSEAQNISDIAYLKPDMMGFIFYEKSERYAGILSNFKLLKNIPKNIQKAGVFVNSQASEITKICNNYSLDIIQLHGNESPETCKQLTEGRIVIKAFSVSNKFDFNSCKEYENCCDYFLFDTKGEKYGGNSIKYNWDILKKYKGKTRFFLSGGLGPEDIDDIKSLNHGQLVGVDINSRFETEPGMKDVSLVKKFITRIRE